MRARSRTTISSQEDNFWPSFTDMISTIAIILFFLILIIFLKNIIIGKEYDIAAALLDETNSKLVSTEEALLINADKISALNTEISEKEQNLMLLETEAEDLALEVEQGNIALTLSEQLIDEQQEIIAMSNAELGDLRTKLEAVAVIRLTVLEQVKAAIEDELDNTSISSGENEVLIGSNGNIILSSQLMFDSDSSQISDEGEQVLDELAVVFERILADDSIRENIDAINIEGHTDDVNTAEYNRELSAQRSISVVNYLLETNETLEEDYGSYFVASAYSEYRPISTGSSEEAKAQNRRIEISIILKDSNIQDIIDSYLEGSQELFNN
jgi:chemotaxis protein MotB